MTRISEAAFDADDYWRIVDVMHWRLRCVNYKEWRQSYKSLVLLEFLVTHGPEDMFEEFHSDMNVIREIGELNFVNERGFNWGSCMQKKSERLLKLLCDQVQLKDARSRALHISKEIQGFGNLIVSPSSSSSSSKTSRTSSFGSNYSDSPSRNKQEESNQQDQDTKATNKNLLDVLGKEVEGLHLWDNPIEEKGSLLLSNENDEEENSSNGWSTGIYSRILGNDTNETLHSTVVGFRSFSNVGKEKKKIGRQLSLGL